MADKGRKDGAECEKCGTKHEADVKCDEEGVKKVDKARKDAEEETAKQVAADKTRKDAEEAAKKDEEEKKVDAKKDAAVISDLQGKIKHLETLLVQPAIPTQRALTSIQAKADKVFAAFGDEAPPALRGACRS